MFGWTTADVRIYNDRMRAHHGTLLWLKSEKGRATLALIGKARNPKNDPGVPVNTGANDGQG